MQLALSDGSATIPAGEPATRTTRADGERASTGPEDGPPHLRTPIRNSHVPWCWPYAPGGG